MIGAPRSASRLSVGELIVALDERLELQVRQGGAHLERPIVSPAIQKVGLILAGLWEYFHPERLQVLGKSEAHYLNAAPGNGRDLCERLCRPEVPAFVLAYDLDTPPALAAASERLGIPVVSSPRSTDKVVEALVRYLATRLAPSVQVHGVLLDIYGLGVLILGESGIGKSESALELVTRGHRLVSDDVVEIREVDDQLVGSSPPLTRHMMEVRGLGIVNAIEMFGVTSVLESKVVEQVVRLFRYEPGVAVDRLGTQRETEILGHHLPLIEIPVAPGRNLAVLLEMAARQQLLSEQGKDASQRLQEDLSKLIRSQEEPESRP